MLGLASRRWSVNKLCQTFSIKAFRADNWEKYLTNNNNSSERELFGWVALLFSVCKWGQYLSASCFVWISSCSEISFVIDGSPWAPLTEPRLATRKQLPSCWHQIGNKIRSEDFACQTYPLGYENHYSKDIVTQNMRALLIASPNPGWGLSVKCNMY